MTGEFQLIRKIIQHWQQAEDVHIGPGDDASAITVITDRDQLFLQTTDLLIEGVHFRKGWGSAYQLGWKSLAVNLSDIAAMGGKPTHTHLSLAIPKSWSEENILELMQGFKALADRFHISLLGGDLSASEVSLMIAGAANGFVHQNQVIMRKGARAGDIIWISGTVGDAAAGLRLLQEGKESEETSELVRSFLEPFPEVDLGLLCAQSGCVNAMIDVSDGLAGDLGHILETSEVGAILYEEKIPISDALKNAAIGKHWDVLELALRGGEDYRLLGTTSEADFGQFNRIVNEKLNKSVIEIGRIESELGLRMQYRNGNCEEINPAAYDHFS